MRVRLEPLSLDREQEFLGAVRRSRSHLRPWATPPATAEHYRQYVARLTDVGDEPRYVGRFVVLRETDELVGAVNLSEIVYGVFQSAYLGCYSFAPFAGRGLTREGVSLALDLAFGRLRLHRIEANIQPDNERSRRLFERIGFRREGLSPQYLKIAGRWRDHERWALLAEEWEALRR